jgi:hypothetical protein
MKLKKVCDTFETSKYFKDLNADITETNSKKSDDNFVSINKKRSKLDSIT